MSIEIANITVKPIIRSASSIYIGQSGSTISGGLYSEDDSAAPSGSVLPTGFTGLYDLDYTTPVASGSTNWSVGADLGSSSWMQGITLYDDGTAGPGMYWSGSNASLRVFASEDNDDWFWVRDYHHLNRVTYLNDVRKIDLQFKAPRSGSYVKAYAFDGGLKSSLGNILKITEMAVWECRTTPTSDRAADFANAANFASVSGSYYPRSTTSITPAADGVTEQTSSSDVLGRESVDEA